MNQRWTTMSRPALAGALGLLLSASVTAQEIDAVEVDRGAIDIRAVLVPRPDVDSTDTALVFSNPGAEASVVVCAGSDANGVGVGRAKTEVPPGGVRLILASDLSDGADFVGSARCKSRTRLTPSAFVVGPGLSDAPAQVVRRRDGPEYAFPIVATF